MTENEQVRVIDLDETPSPKQMQAWVLEAAMTGKRKIIKVKGEIYSEIG